MDAKLIVVGGDTPISEYDITLPTTIGRSRNSDLVITQPLVSRHHCELYELNGKLMVRDLGSLNGTFVGSARITSDSTLEPGSLLSVGPVTFRASYGAATSEDTVVAERTVRAHEANEPKPRPSSQDLDQGMAEGSDRPAPMPIEPHDLPETTEDVPIKAVTKPDLLGDRDLEVPDFRTVDPASEVELAETLDLDPLLEHEALGLSDASLESGETTPKPPNAGDPDQQAAQDKGEDLDNFFKSLE